jgi:hypothetical protein
VVNRVEAAELRVVAAAVLPQHYAHLVTALTSLHVQNFARRSRLEAGRTREKKSGGGSGKRKKLSVAVRHGKQEILAARALVSQTEE